MIKYSPLTFFIIFNFFACNNNVKNKTTIISISNDSLKRELNSIHFLDQEFRGDTTLFGIRTQISNDALNLWKVENILKKFGWPSKEEIGESGSETILLVLLHSHISIQRKYLPIVRQAVIDKKLSGKSWALLEDRVSLLNTGKQIFGSQIEFNQNAGQYFISPIIDEKNVNIRRNKIGLEDIEDYAKNWGIKYSFIEQKK